MTKTMITGATGTIGGLVTEALLDAGVENVTVVTRRPEAAAKWVARGAAVAEVDLLAVDTLEAAFAGVDRLFLVGPQPENFGARVADVIDAAKRAGVKHVVRLSAIGASPDGHFDLAREHGLADRALAQSGLGYTILQPTFFQENFLKFQGQSIREQGAFYGSSGEGKTAYISGRDIARVAVAALRDPAAHAGKTYTLTGPEALADTEVAALIGELTGREVKYVDVPAEPYRASMLEGGMPAWMADNMLALENVKRAGYAADVAPDLAQVLDGAPETLRGFFERHRGQLA